MKHPTTWKKTVEVLIAKYRKDQTPILASGIVYNTLISVIPFFSFLVTFLTLFDVLQPFYESLTALFVSIFGNSAGNDLIRLVARYSGNATSLGIVGLISFGFTSLLLMNKVYSVVNHIYDANLHKESMMKRTGTLVTALLLGVILIASFVGVKSVFSSFVINLLEWEFYSQIVQVFLQHVLPWLIAWVFVFSLLKLAPKSKVFTSSAGIGATVATVGMLITNTIFSAIVNSLFSLSVIYGSFAVVFIFLLWIYVIWLVILFGSQVSYVHQYRPEAKMLSHPVSPAEQLAGGINVMMVIGSHFRDGKGETKVREISERLLMNEKQLFEILNTLEQNNYIIATSPLHASYIPARPLEDLKVRDIAEDLFGEVFLEQNVDTAGNAVTSQVHDKGIKTLGNLSIAHLLERV
ncbi:MAG: YihY family inner membrane protein [Sphaerochaetaceae bacterium]|nr:YihY family inner membrane protein [Sphaerochaetaceae bacterium]